MLPPCGAPEGRRYVGPNGAVVSLERFGASAPREVLMVRLGFTPENVVDRAKALLRGKKGRSGRPQHAPGYPAK